MFVRHLSLADYRSWPAVEVPLAAGVNVFLGRNGSGKTNLVEALGYLATLSSHRVATDAPLIRRGTTQAVIRAAVVSAGRELLLEVEVNSGRPNRARINRAPQSSVRAMLGVLRTVTFAPEDLALVRGDPAERRRMLDELLIMRAPRLAGVRADYDRILKQRNALLKTSGGARRAGAALDTLQVWDEQLATTGGELLHERLALTAALRPHVTAAYAGLAPGPGTADIAYRSSLGAAMPAGGMPAGASPTGALPTGALPTRDRVTEDLPPAADLAAALLAEMQRLRPTELDRGISLIGPHRDDLDLLLADGPAKGYASHGESWSFALALRLGCFALLRSDGVDPVLVLDDVFAELDTSRRERLADLVGGAEQVLVTAAVEADLPAALSGRWFTIADGRVEPVEPPTAAPSGQDVNHADR